MHSLFESGDPLNMPFECFFFDAVNENFPVRPHWHYFVEMIYLLDGEAEMHDETNSYAMKKGDFILFHPKAIHSIFSADDASPRYAVIKFDLNRLNATPSYAPKLKYIFRSAEQKHMPIFFPKEVADCMQCRTLALQCIQELQEKKYGYDLLIQANLYQLMMQIVRQWQTLGFSIENDIYQAEIACDMDSITEFIDSHMKDALQVGCLAHQCGMSYSSFAKKFHAMYGISCKEYIEKVRIVKVEDFLLFTDFDLSYISQETGFSDCSHMIKNFKKIHGITPKQFRLQRATAMKHEHSSHDI